jgi:predicted nucleotidyltransferase
MKVADVFAKDFIETEEGLIFAVVAQGTEQNKVLCFLRYVYETPCWIKYQTAEANIFLEQNYPAYLHYSAELDAHLHAVSTDRIVRHYQPRHRLQQIMQAKQHDCVEQDVFRLCEWYQQHGLDLSQAGITGSILIGAQQHSSDIDLVCYERNLFHACRAVTRELIDQGQLQALNDKDWQQAYARRSCALSFAEYVRHEQRKYNKAMINGRKFDLSFIDPSVNPQPGNYQKCGSITLQCRIIDDARAFDYPAEYKIDHAHISSIVSFTATYTGQAINGETVEALGMLEQTAQGNKRLVVGSSREAPGEYIKVIHG